MTGPSARDPLPGEPEHRDRWPDTARPDELCGTCREPVVQNEGGWRHLSPRYFNHNAHPAPYIKDAARPDSTPEWRDVSPLRAWVVEHIAERPYGPREELLGLLDSASRLPRRAASVLTEQEGGPPNERYPDPTAPELAGHRAERVTSDRLARSGVPCSTCGMPYDRCTVLVLDQGRPCCSSCGRVNTHDEREVTPAAESVTERLEAQAADAVADLTDALDLDAGARDVLAVVTCCLHGERGYCAALVAPSVPPATDAVLTAETAEFQRMVEANRDVVAETSGVTPTAVSPWTVTLCWTPHQNFGRVSTIPGRAPVFALVGRLNAGETPQEVADDYGVPGVAVEVLDRLRGELPDMLPGTGVGDEDISTYQLRAPCWTAGPEDDVWGTEHHDTEEAAQAFRDREIREDGRDPGPPLRVGPCWVREVDGVLARAREDEGGRPIHYGSRAEALSLWSAAPPVPPQPTVPRAPVEALLAALKDKPLPNLDVYNAAAEVQRHLDGDTT